MLTGGIFEVGGDENSGRAAVLQSGDTGHGVTGAHAVGAQGHGEGPAERAEALPRGWMAGAAVRGAFPAPVWGTRSHGRRGAEGRWESASSSKGLRRSLQLRAGKRV